MPWWAAVGAMAGRGVFSSSTRGSRVPQSSPVVPLAHRSSPPSPPRQFLALEHFAKVRLSGAHGTRKWPSAGTTSSAGTPPPSCGPQNAPLGHGISMASLHSLHALSMDTLCVEKSVVAFERKVSCATDLTRI